MLMQTQAYFKKSLARNILSGLELGEFTVYYQPKFDLTSRKIIGLEALSRWYASGVGWISPAEFIPVAESTGAIIPLGERVLVTACKQTKYWQENGYPELSVAVNLSSIQLEEKNIVTRVEDILSQTGLDPRYLELEVTESVLIKNSIWALEVLKQFRKIGIKLAIDDFGTGYSTIGYLTTYPFDSLKLDQIFAKTIHLTQTQLVVRAMANLARQLGLTTLLEGVEEQTELVMARHLGCDQVQGHAVSPPQPAGEIVLAMENYS
ncbi:MAG: EAL domain-containing protein [Nitrospinaceae bacterium]|nr:EAL domain-containing protein [Nitrospinaceae bacterium]